MGKTAVHFGGGNIGRGFVAEKLNISGYEVGYFTPSLQRKLPDLPSQVVFIDVMDSIIELLQKNKSYTVTEIGGDGEKVNTITNYRAINSKTHEADVIKEIASAEIVGNAPYWFVRCFVTIPTGYLRCWPQYSQMDRPRYRQGH